MPRGTDYDSITGPMSRSMGMVADHLLRAPQVQYRLNQERQKIANDTAETQARVANYGAQTEAHKQAARKSGSEADSQEMKNASVKWLNENDQTFSGLVDAGQVSPEAMNSYAHHYAVATGKSFDDTVKGLTALAQARKAALGANPRDVATMTGPGATSVANQDSKAATELATIGMKPTVVPERASVLPPNYMKDKTEPYVQPTRSRPGSENNLYDPAERQMLTEFGKQAVDAQMNNDTNALALAQRGIQNIKGARTPTPAALSGKTLDKATAAELLKETGGDKNKARELAKQRGYSF